MSTPSTSTWPPQSDWNGEQGRHWAETADRHDAFLAPVAEVLLAAADAAAGMHVVDIGCGCGATTLLVAERVGESGRATGIDISEPMLAVAHHRARRFGPGAPTFIQANVEAFHFDQATTDLVISRFGTMSFTDPAIAFRNIASSLRPHGRLCIVTWQPLVANEWLLVPAAALVTHAPLAPPPEGPGMFAQSDPEVVRATLRAAGFVDVAIEPVVVEFDCGPTVDAALEFFVQSGSGRHLLDTIPIGPPRDAAIADVRNALAEHDEPGDGVRLDGAIWLVTAARGAS